jgi:Ca2+-transporting ATPase
MNWYKLSVEEAVKELATDPENGLTSAEARTRLERHGPNELVERGGIKPWRILFNQFTELMVIILIAAAIISLLLDETLDAVVILAIVLLNAAIGFSQEYRAEQAMAALKRLAVPTVRVRRDGEVQEVSSTALVPGDVVLLEAGNVVPADGHMLTGANLKIEEAALTGESEPVDKLLRVPDGDDLSIGDRYNMVYMGTSVTYGRGSIVVVDTGMATELGHIAELIQGVEEEQTPLQRRLDRLGKTLAVAALGIIALVVLFGLLRGEDLENLILTGISMAVAAIPEGLPAVVTITLALGSQRLLKRNALIRKLPAVETLGSVTVICSDKTGTLTENRMTVTILDVAGNRSHIDTLVDSTEGLLRSELIDEEDPELTALSVLVRAGALCNDATVKHGEDGSLSAIGDPTEGALLLAANRLGYDKVDLDHRWPRVGEVPFTSERKRMTTIHRMDESVQQTDLPWGNSPYVALSKGAVDSLIDVTDTVLVDNEIVPLTEELHQRILNANAELAGQGQRVLGVAFRFWDSPEIPEDQSILEQEEVFAGMVAMMDPPRPEAKAAVATALEAGIRPVMITGDHPLTAIRIAQDLGITDDEECLTGTQLAQMSIEDLQPIVGEIEVYARVAPEHKLNIVQALQNNGQVAAMTGDGVNDAPALKQAEIGIAMGITGTDVAKEAADMVLLDDNFATIVAAVEEGRVIFDNIRKFILYTLSSNAGELWVMLLGPFLGMPLPLRPLQILWVNLVTDGLPGLALAQEQGEPGVMKRKPFEPKESVFSRGIGSKILWIGFIMGMVSLLVGYFAWVEEGRPADSVQAPWQTMVFTTLVLAQMGNALAIRSGRESLFTIGIFSNRLMVFAVLTTFVLQLALIYVPFLQDVFKTVALTAGELAICLVSSTVVFISVEIYKWFFRRRNPLQGE